METFESFVDNVEELIRAGRISQARTYVKARFSRGIARGQAVAFASLARRAGLAELGTQCLHPVVREGALIGNAMAGKVTATECAEYGACLSDIGALDEAESLLRRIDPADVPDANYFRTLPLLAREDFRAAIPFLTQYVADRRVREYPRAIGKIALLEALVHDRQPSKAVLLVEDLVDDSLFRRDPILMGRALLSLAKNSVLGRKWEDARVLIARARERIDAAAGLDPDSADRTSVENWECFLQTRRSGDTGTLDELRDRRMAAGDWGSVRDCDWIEALTTREERLAAKVYFGTPHVRFRERFVEMMGAGWYPPAQFTWEVDGFEAAGVGLDLAREKDPAAKKLLNVLCSDFYHPIPISTIFFRIRPEATFHPQLSAAKVREDLARLALIFEEGHLPLFVEQVGDAFRLRARGPIGVGIANADSARVTTETFLLKWRHRFGSEPFGIGQAAAEIDASERAVKALLEQAENEGWVVREEGGRRVQFRLS